MNCRISIRNDSFSQVKFVILVKEKDDKGKEINPGKGKVVHNTNDVFTGSMVMWEVNVPDVVVALAGKRYTDGELVDVDSLSRKITLDCNKKSQVTVSWNNDQFRLMQ